jgi:sulfite reductase alpha subunit
MAKELYNTPNLDELENGPWPSLKSNINQYFMRPLHKYG